MPLTIVRNDITLMKTDAIVNAANINLIRGAGVCGAIFRAAGSQQLQEACAELAPVKTGEAVITSGFNLPAKYIIHTVGPIYRQHKENSAGLLSSCYRQSLKLAVENNCESIAFPLISTGVYGYPKAEAIEIANKTIREFLLEHDIDVVLVVYDKQSYQISEELLGGVKNYLELNLSEAEADIEVDSQVRRSRLYREMSLLEAESSKKQSYETTQIDYLPTSPLSDLVVNLDESFSEFLLRLIDSTGKSDAEVYHKANINRRLFSKIRSNKHYTPSKPTVLAFAIALELTLQKTNNLLQKAGFALSRSREFDVIVEYFIVNKIYDIFLINEVLFKYDQPLLGGSGF